MAGGGKELLWSQFGNQPIPHKQDLELGLSSLTRKKYKGIIDVLFSIWLKMSILVTPSKRTLSMQGRA